MKHFGKAGVKYLVPVQMKHGGEFSLCCFTLAETRYMPLFPFDFSDSGFANGKKCLISLEYA